MNRPLQIDIRTAGKMLGLKSPSSAYRHVPEILPCITLTRNRVVVPVSALAAKLGVDLETVWTTADALTAEKSPDQEESEERAAIAAAAEKRRLAAIDKQVNNMPAVKAAERAAKAAKGQA